MTLHLTHASAHADAEGYLADPADPADLARLRALARRLGLTMREQWDVRADVELDRYRRGNFRESFLGGREWVCQPPPRADNDPPWKEPGTVTRHWYVSGPVAAVLEFDRVTSLGKEALADIREFAAIAPPAKRRALTKRWHLDGYWKVRAGKREK